ncbi:DUF6537 domain-containing protein [Cupriavidus lacunae]|uniref:DUF6537 domain-containing protein n=1 Tax=Cupriavidus lacunae TaxID=2666307 RepID=A0A370NQU5_9BURK|nr:hypothetical protein DN412_23120 [Cupriavidus lacunae]
MRDTAFDIFGRPTERRAERQLIAEYLATVEELAQSLSDGKLDTAVALASLTRPDDTTAAARAIWPNILGTLKNEYGKSTAVRCRASPRAHPRR